MRRRLIFAVWPVALLAACALPRPAADIRARPPFPDEEYAGLAIAGTSTVAGQGFLKTRGGDVKVAAGNTVTLEPVTSYSEHWYRIVYALGLQIEQADAKLDGYIRTVQADGSGRFVFKKVPPGDYFASTVVSWESPSSMGLLPQGGLIVKRIRVANGADLEAMITR